MLRLPNSIKLLAITLACASLCLSCTIAKKPPPPRNKTLSWSKRLQTIDSIQHWQILGAIHLQSENASGTVTLIWQQNHEHFHIRLLAPLGIQLVQLKGTPKQLTLINAKGKQHTSNSPERLLKAKTGWELPISNLLYWIKGRPAPKSKASITYDRYNHIKELQQDNWHVAYPCYTLANNYFDLPCTIELSHPEMKGTISIYRWQLFSHPENKDE